MKVAVIAGAATLALSFAGYGLAAEHNGFMAPKAPAGYYGKQKVVYHINTKDPHIWNAALGNVQNHLNAVGKNNVDMRVVLHGDGVDLLKAANKNPDLQSKIINLKNEHVAFEVCGITLQKKHIDPKNDLFDVDVKKDIVPSGVAEIARLQGMGYVYVKP